METRTNNDSIKLTNDGSLRKLLFMTLVVFVSLLVLGIAGFFLWFAFPVETINGLTYLKGNNLIYYYLILNFLNISGILLASHMVYFKHIETKTPLKDGVWLGLYLVAFSWIIDLFVYVVIRKTLPSIHEYFLGKNQPEIGIAWLVAFASAALAGWMHQPAGKLVRSIPKKKWAISILLLTAASAFLTIIGILYFDIKP